MLEARRMKDDISALFRVSSSHTDRGFQELQSTIYFQEQVVVRRWVVQVSLTSGMLSLGKESQAVDRRRMLLLPSKEQVNECFVAISYCGGYRRVSGVSGRGTRKENRAFRPACRSQENSRGTEPRRDNSWLFRREGKRRDSIRSTADGKRSQQRCLNGWQRSDCRGRRAGRPRVSARNCAERAAG
jgi:hypothetical protein